MISESDQHLLPITWPEAFSSWRFSLCWEHGELTGGPLLGLSQQHLFYDAIVLSLFGIGMYLDG